MSVSHIVPKPWTGRDDPEEGETARRMHHCIAGGGETAIIGFACDTGVARNQGRTGAAEAPAAIRSAMASLAVAAPGPKVTDLGDIVVSDSELESGQDELADKITNALKLHNHVLVLGGGHETAFGSYMGLSRHFSNHKIGIINLDAHLDLRKPGKAGSSSGTPFYQIKNLVENAFDYLCIGVADEANTTALYTRASEWGVDIVKDGELAENPNAANNAITEIIERSDIIYLTIDMDVLPHYQAPGVSAPATRGVSFKTIERIIDHIYGSCERLGKQVPLADIVEVSPPHDRDNVTARTAAYLARQIIIKSQKNA